MTVIAIEPHPDDPEEGAGGTLACIASSGETRSPGMRIFFS